MLYRWIFFIKSEKDDALSFSSVINTNWSSHLLMTINFEFDNVLSCPWWMFYSSARARFPHPRIIAGWERVRTWNGWSKRSGREDGRNLEVGQDQIGNQVYTTFNGFYNRGKRGDSAWLSLSFRLARSESTPLKSRLAAISSETDGVIRDVRTGIDPGVLSKRLFPRSLTFTDFLLERVLAFRLVFLRRLLRDFQWRATSLPKWRSLRCKRGG